MTLSKNELTSALMDMSMFSGMSKKEISRSVGTAVQRQFAAGKPIVQDGKGGVGFYLILDGKVAVKKDDQVINELVAGQFFGEVALLEDDSLRTADVIAVEDTNCLVMSSWDFKAFMSTSPKAAAHINDILARRNQG
jgi:CRP-like cAMP-binding protein